MIILIKKILSILKAPREMEGGEEEPTDLIQKTITFVSSSLDRALSQHDVCSSRLCLLIARQA